MIPSDFPWSEATTLEQHVTSLIEQKRTKTAEFQTLLRVFGRARIEAIWKAHRDKAKENACAPGEPVPPSGSQ